MAKKKKRTEFVKTHYRPIKGKMKKVKSYKRKPKPKARKGIHKAETRKFTVQYWRDDQGRLVSKRKYTKNK